jgi:lactate permease
MRALLALAPIGLILVLMVGLRWSAARAGIAGLLGALAIALAVFDYGDGAPGMAIAGALVEAAFIAATILWIILPALCIYELQAATGGVQVLKAALQRLSPDPRLMAILIGWFLALFLEGAAGFGTPIALTAPLLVGIGYRPVEALTIALIGHAVGVSFGAVGTPVLPQIAATDLSAGALARAIGQLHGLLGWILLLLMMRVVARSTEDGAAATSVWPWTIGAALAFLLPFWALAHWVGPELPTLGGALLGGLAFTLMLRVWHRPNPGSAGAAPDPAATAERPDPGRLVRAGLPYLVLLGLILATRLIEPLRAALDGLTIEWTLWDEFRGSMAPLYHPGTMLMLGFVLGGLMQGAGARQLTDAGRRAAKRLVPVLVALLAMLALSRIMVHAGMIDALAQAAAGTFRGAWPLVAPAVGVLGTFVTGSATASNILFTDFQEATATELGLPVLTLVAAQGFGAAVGNIICPHNIIAGGATVGLAGQEGEVLRRTILACAIYLAAGGALVYLLVSVGP